MTQKKFTAEVTQDLNGGYTAVNPQTGISAQGKTTDDALDNLLKALKPHLGPDQYQHKFVVTSMNLKMEFH